MILTEAEARDRALEAFNEPGAVQAAAAALRRAQKEAIEACREIISGDNRPERVCCIGTRGDILRKLGALIED